MKQVLQRFFCLALGCAAVLTTARADQTKTPRVTKDNFVSLEFFTRSQPRQPGYWLRLDSGGLRMKTEQTGFFGGGGGGFSGNFGPFQQGFGASQWSESAPLSSHQFKAALKTIDGAQLPKYVGVTRGKSPFPEFTETLTLTLSDSKNRDQKFALQSFGDGAPRAFKQVAEFLRKLRGEKFPGSPIPASALTARENLASLTLQKSGGFAGLSSVLVVAPRPSNSSLGGWTLNFSQTIGGQETKKETDAGFKEIDEIVRLINLADFANLNGQSFRQEGLSDGFNETLTLVLKDGQTFSVSNYGDAAPPQYLVLARYLRELQQKKSN